MDGQRYVLRGEFPKSGRQAGRRRQRSRTTFSRPLRTAWQTTVLIGVVTSACQTAAVTPDSEVPTVVTEATPTPGNWQPNSALACSVTVPAGAQPRVLEINGTSSGFGVGEDADVIVFPYNAGSVALAVRQQWRPWEPGPAQATLHQVSCAAPHKMTPLVTRDGADFGHSAMTGDGGTLLFSDGGVSSLDMASLQVKQMLPRPPASTKSSCGPTPVASRFIVEGLVNQDRDLAVTRYEPCSFAHDWEGTAGVLSEFSLHAQPTFQPLSPAASVAADVAGALWLGDGGRCHSPGIRDPQSPGVVWRSTDQGAHWTPMHFGAKSQDDDEAPSTGIVRIEVGRQAGQVAALSRVCSSSNIGTFGGTLHVTNDSGKTWRRITPPDGFIVTQFGDGISEFTLVNGDFNHVRTWAYRPTTSDRVAWDTRDGGSNWVVTGDSSLGPPNPSTSATVNGVEFLATNDGLVARGSNRSEVTVFRTLDIEPARAHCVALRPTRSSADSLAKLVERLAEAGYSAAVDKERVAIKMSNEDVERFFAAPVTYRRTGASQSSARAWVALLQADIPRAWKRQIASASIDPAGCGGL